MTFGERLTQLRKDCGYSTRTELAEKLGIPSTTLRNYETDVREPGHTFLKQISELFNVSVDYLLCLTDEKEKRSSQSLKASEYTHINKYRSIDERGKDIVDVVLNREYERHTETIKPKLTHEPKAIPKVIEFDPEEVETITLKHSEYKASAGTGYILFDDCLEEDLKVVFNNLTRKADICIDVYGNSMEPKYHDKDILLVRKQPDVEIGEIGIFIIDDKGFVKKKGTEGLISINKDYDIIPKSEDIKCFGKVLGVLQKEWIV